MTDPDTPADIADPHPLAFIPVATGSTRHDGWTAERQRRFIGTLALTGVVATAAKAAGKTTASAYRLRRRPGAASFAAAWEAALDQGRERAFEIAADRAVNGITVPRFYRGRFCGTTHRFDTRALVAALLPAQPPRPRAK